MKEILMKLIILPITVFSATALANPTGSWQLECFPFQHLKQSEIIEFKSDGTGTISRTIYANNTCTQPIYKIFEDIVFDTGLTYDSGATQLNLNVKTAKVEPISPEGLSLLQSQNYCGIGDWVLGQENNVLTKTCTLTVSGKEFTDFYHTPNEPAYTVYKVWGD